MEVILASSSPRRRALLEQLGVDATIRPADIDETPLPGEAAAVYVERLAVEKAHTVTTRGALIIAADTTVTIDGELLGKPRSESEARSHLRRLSGRVHAVLTGVAVAVGGEFASGVESTSVTFTRLSESDINWYVATGEPHDKAGSYAIQGAAGVFVTGIEGSFDNVIGLPRHLLRRLVADLGHEFLFSAANQADQWDRRLDR